MAFTQQGAFTFLHSNQPDNLSSIMSASQIKASFDSQANELKTTLNKLIVDLGSRTANNSGAENIGIEPVSGVTGTNVADCIIDMAGQLSQTVRLVGNSTVSGTFTATTLNGSSVVQEGGIALTSKYLRLDGTNSMANKLTIGYGSGSGAQLFINQTSNDSQLLFTADQPENVITSGTVSGASTRNLRISGVGGNNIPTVTVKADSFVTNNQTINGNLLITSISTSPLIVTSPSGTGADGTFKFSATSSFNYLQFSNAAQTAPKSVKITGQNASAVLDELYFVSNVVKREGDVIARAERGTRIDNLVALGGNKVMTNTDVVTLSVALPDCPNGFILEWRQSTSTAFLHYSAIYKFQSLGSVTHVTAGYNDPNIYTGKVITVNGTGTTITGSTSNTVGNSNNRVLSAVYCF